MGRGTLIVFEGCGQINQSDHIFGLVTRLNEIGIRTKMKQFPDLTTPIGNRINDFLNQKTYVNPTTLSLLFSANRWEQAQMIIDELNNGTTLIIDGYSMSGIACGTIHSGDDLEYYKLLEQGLPAPDLVVAFETAKGYLNTLNYETQRKVFETLKNLSTKQWYFVKPSRYISLIYDNLFLIIQRIVLKTLNKPILNLFEN